MSSQSTATYTARYRNTFFKGANRTEYGPEFFETDVRPVEYRGFQIYHRQDNCWDIVADGACIGQYAGPNGARRRIDVLCSHASMRDLAVASDDDYSKYRGKCKVASEAAVAADPSLTLVRGHYVCPFWGEQPHWWTKRADGTVFDPTARQFPSKGFGEYVEFNGLVSCSECGKEMKEEEAEFESNYCFCSYECHGRFVGVF